MSNTLKTLSDGDILRECQASFHNKLKFLKTIDRQYDGRFDKVGAKNGGSILIRLPNEYTVTTGATMAVQDMEERTMTMTVATQKHVAMNYTSAEATLSMDEFKKRHIDPAMSRLAAEVEYSVLVDRYVDVYNQTGTPATTPASLAAALNANARLSKCLAPDSDRHILMDSDAMAGTVAAMSVYFHPATALEKAISEGYLGRAANMNWWESNMVPNHTNGTRTDTTPVATIGGTVTVPTGGIVNGTAVITMTAFPDGLTYKKGDIFTVADVYACNLETKQRYSHLQQFVVTADETETGSGDMTPAVSPTPYASGSHQNIVIASTGAKAVVNLTGGGSGAASLVSVQNLAYHRSAFAVAFADLERVNSGVATYVNIEGIPMRLWKSSDIINDKHPCRIDVIYGSLTTRAAWACRVRG